jgi:predicted nucleic acid-binding Zn ribbon protein
MAWETDEAAITCLGCGQALRGGKFCSAACHQRELRRRRRARLLRFCARCSVAFVPIRSDARFCSGSCRQKAYRRRKASSEEAPARPTAAPWRAFTSAPRAGSSREAVPEARVAAARIDVRALIG